MLEEELMVHMCVSPLHPLEYVVVEMYLEYLVVCIPYITTYRVE